MIGLWKAIFEGVFYGAMFGSFIGVIAGGTIVYLVMRYLSEVHKKD